MRLAWHLGPVLRGLRGHRAAATLVAAQFAIGLAIAVFAVLIGDYFAGTRKSVAASPERELLVVELQLPGRSADLEARRAAVLGDIRGLASCEGAAVVDRVPLRALEPDLDLVGDVQATAFFAGAGIVRVVGLQLVAGRDLVEADLRAPVAAAIVSPGLARRLAPGADALGTRFQSRARGPAIVVGVAHLRSHMFGNSELAAVYAAEHRLAHSVIAVRAAPGRAGELRAALAELLVRPGQHARVSPVIEHLAHLVSPVDAVLGILATIVGTIIFVVLMGSMGLTYFLVSTRTREIGLRRAMGARRRDVAWHFLLESTLVTLAGGLVGLAIVLAVLPVMLHQMEGFVVRWWLVATTVAAIVVLNLLAALVPARKASAVPPVVASRS
jgi:putative ABC transport system permease protein